MSFTSGSQTMSSYAPYGGQSNRYTPRRPYAKPLGRQDFRSSTETVTIPRSEYTRLILIYGTAHLKSQRQNDENLPVSPPKSDETLEGGTTGCQEHTEAAYRNADFDDNEDGHEDEEALLDPQGSEGKDDYDESSRSAGSSPTPGAQRTVMIRNLPDRVTHRDIVEAVRGGALLHIYLRARERIASVSFVEEVAARDFLLHTKTYGLYMAGKRVEVGWNDRQFYLPPYVRVKINNGASRNLVIYNVQPNVTEWVIRKDLDHIHNLIVISVKFKNGNAYISTNSVHNALFARSCMMSRFMYKGMKIGFYADECMESPAKSAKKEPQAPPKKAAPVNRFQLLSLDGGEDDDDHANHNGLGMNNGMRWADNSVSA
ncbi:RNA-binding protein [Aspergillus ibericus CBS 121593]|uniref:RRM domain-containing protein n=1 Tax=Aspergillus ibericus CBS 121593 TaxID=1448316 RepID=A0A395H157_9EURO|nr:hypothetical protein BO80DRAFT_473321 [Aspergillus ibericus CBS 121593]RAL01586.1 hypothetical protein BO80DRAFT_473321 [Aspergillus ibericus CBS 121593]